MNTQNLLRSMTGFGMSEIHTPNFEIKAEIKSLNGKFLDLNFRIPKMLAPFEIKLRNTVSNLVERGTISVSITVNRLNASSDDVQINSDLATLYFQKFTGLAQTLQTSSESIFELVMKMPDIVTHPEPKPDDELYELVEKCLLDAYQHFDMHRIKDGENTALELEQYNREIMQCIPMLDALENERMVVVKERIYKNLQAILEDEKIDKNRFEQELIYYLEKFDISEEKVRLSSHCQYFSELLKDSPKGKKISFLSQEMGREINTIGSKANHAEMQKIVVEMKDLLEKIKEQVLNIV